MPNKSECDARPFGDITGTVRAPFETLVKIMAAVGAKLVVVRR